MQYNAKTPADYFDMLEPDWRKEKLQQVRELIFKIAPELKEGIEYKMLSYRNESQSIFHLNAQKAYVGLYVGTIDKVKNARELLKDFDMGKGCIRIKKSVNISETDLEEFIQKAVDLYRDGGEMDC